MSLHVLTKFRHNSSCDYSVGIQSA